MENLRSRDPVDVPVLAVGFDQFLITGHAGENAQFNLGIIRIREAVSFSRHKSLPDEPTHLSPHRNILQIRIARADPPCCRNGLMKHSMNPAVRSYVIGEAVRIGGLQLGHRAIFQNVTNRRAVRCKPVQYICSSGPSSLCFLAAGQFHLFKQHLSQLFGRADIELSPCFLINPLFQFGRLFSELSAVILQRLRKNADAYALHIIEDIRKRELHSIIEIPHIFLSELFHQSRCRSPEAVSHGTGILPGFGRFRAECL